MWRFLLLGLAAGELPRKVLLPSEVAANASAKCLDSSPAGFYIREQDPSKWVIFLDGGGLCIDALDCRRRAATTHGSSKNWPETWDPEAVPFSTGLSSTFRDFSQVFVPYCSGDLWLGMDHKPRLIVGDLQMSGHRILGAVVEHLVNTTALRRSSLLIFAGQSAGGIGVLHHADWISSKLSSLSASPRIAVLSAAGLFFPADWPVLWEEFRLGMEWPVDNFMAKWCHLIEGSFLHEGCVAAARAAGRAPSTCQDVSRILPELKADVFLMQNQFDQYQVLHLGLCPASTCSVGVPATSAPGRYLALLGRLTNATLSAAFQNNSRFGIYAPSRFDHTDDLMQDLAGTDHSISGVSFKDAFGHWLSGAPTRFVAASCAGLPCPSGQEADARALIV
ncbi:notum1a [Symbiodinium natans]|uniref:Notum1a protein n=1 Tax=Symbiodinium natans TaxID=878477 RepID=A0A812RP92_9DINO|nr:notum1a [Symbiodinium natans]